MLRYSPTCIALGEDDLLEHMERIVQRYANFTAWHEQYRDDSDDFPPDDAFIDSDDSSEYARSHVSESDCGFGSGSSFSQGSSLPYRARNSDGGNSPVALLDGAVSKNVKSSKNGQGQDATKTDAGQGPTNPLAVDARRHSLKCRLPVAPRRWWTPTNTLPVDFNLPFLFCQNPIQVNYSLGSLQILSALGYRLPIDRTNTGNKQRKAKQLRAPRNIGLVSQETTYLGANKSREAHGNDILEDLYRCSAQAQEISLDDFLGCVFCLRKMAEHARKMRKTSGGRVNASTKSAIDQTGESTGIEPDSTDMTVLSQSDPNIVSITTSKSVAKRERLIYLAKQGMHVFRALEKENAKVGLQDITAQDDQDRVSSKQDCTAAVDDNSLLATEKPQDQVPTDTTVKPMLHELINFAGAMLRERKDGPYLYDKRILETLTLESALESSVATVRQNRGKQELMAVPYSVRPERKPVNHGLVHPILVEAFHFQNHVNRLLVDHFKEPLDDAEAIGLNAWKRRYLEDWYKIESAEDTVVAMAM